ncbi:MAG: hypothetical protein NC408_02345 [Candidatus Gastranaerophilales bacterium]|nr:hypothetical protein [Candidatus Gastranaerophilales bacterium]
MANQVLEGRIGNYKYIWHSNDCACAKCQALEGSEYDNEKDIPDKPHPNCKCYIEVVEQDRCDCLDDLLTKLGEIIGDAMALQSEILSGINFFTNILITKKCSSPALAIIESCIDALQQIIGTINDFIRNYNEMRDANSIGADKYFHSKANCDGAKRGELGALVAKGISDLREFTDLFKNVLVKGMTIAERLEDSAD